MPYLGQSPFLLPKNVHVNLSEWHKFQCPISGNRHFYSVQNGPYPVSITAFQCPISGNRHFYCRRNHIGSDSDRQVSMPYLGQSPFLQGEENLPHLIMLGFNALSRAIAISTVKRTAGCSKTKGFQCPISGNRHFYDQRKEIKI